MATIQELESFNLSDAVSFHKELNPRLWEDEKLDKEVRDQLLLIAEDFVEYLGISNLNVQDVTISGSNAAYSYTPHSDIDLHILVDFNDLPNNEVYQELFTAKKTLYNDAHDITVHGIPVELYVQDTNNPVQSLGEYSIVYDKWIRIPKRRKANFDQAATKLKYEKLGDLIELALTSKNIKKINDTIALVRRYRKSGLDKTGEFGPENLAFKAVRKQGLIKRLYDLKSQLHGERLSIEEYATEDYDPNGPPPGPEFKPTMPKGTVRVDVSDVYDWYKLGQHISNLKGLGKHDFGKGPPSTILSFGDEDTEHKYIDDLEKTGLTTTDIDPVDPNQPKGMKRQKTDPTFNVNETANRKAANEVSEKFSTDNRPKLIGLSFSDLEKLSESAGSDYNKFDRNISAKLNLPKHKGSVSNTLNLYSVYRKQQIYESTNKRLSDTEKKLFSIFNSRVTSTIDSVKPGDSVSLLMLSTLSIPNEKIFVNLQGFLNPKQVESITSSNGIEYLHFDDGTKFPETDNDDPMYLSQSWAMTKLFDSYDSASKAYLMYALEGEKSSDEIQFNTNVDIKQHIAETDPLLEFRFQEIVHTNPTVATLKSLAKNNKYGAARFTITQNGTLKAGDSEKFTHQDISPDYKNVVVRGYVTHASGNDYIFKGSGPYDGNYTIDHPMFRKFERAGLINGNKDQIPVTEDNVTDIGEKIKNSLGLQQFYVFERGDTIEVSSLIVGKENQGKGLGSKAMQQLIDYADNNNKRITLTPGSKDKTHGTTSRARLVQFYKSLGFKESKGRNLDYAIGAGKMYRDPKSNVSHAVTNEASGYIPSAKEKNDPRFKTALTVDVKPSSIKDNAKAFNWKTSRAGIPPQARADGKLTEALVVYAPDKKFATELEEFQHICSTVKDFRARFKILESLGSKTLTESKQEFNDLCADVIRSLGSLSAKNLKVGNAYIPAQVAVHRSVVAFYDVKNNSPAQEPAEFGTLVKLDPKAALVKIGNTTYQYPIDLTGANTMMMTVFLDTVEKYDQFRMMAELKFDQNLPLYKDSNDTVGMNGKHRKAPADKKQ